MPFPRPTLEQLIERGEQQLAARVGVPQLGRRSVLAALSRVMAGASHHLHGHLDWIARQVFPDTADEEHLDRWGVIWEIGRRPATRFAGLVRATGLEGAEIPAGTRLQSQAGAEYETTVDAEITTGEAEVAIRALEPGAASNIEAGVTLSFVTPVVGVQTSAELLGDELVLGVDVEGDPSFRERILARMRLAPHGGAAHDYVQWALEVSGVTRAWVFPLMLGPGTVGITFAADDAPGGPIPSPELVELVQEHLDLERPVTADVLVFAPTARVIDATIRLSPDSFELRAGVEASLRDLLRREGVPGETLLVSHVREAVSTTPGENDHELVSWDGEEPADIEFDFGELAVLGEVTWL